MPVLRWIVGASLFLALLFLSLQNAELVTLKFYHWWSWQAPLVFVVLIAFAIGVAAGLLAGALRVGAPEAPAQPAAARAARRHAPAAARRRGPGARHRARTSRLRAPASTASPRPLAADARRRAMDFELWWLLPIPAVFFALGWIAARIDIKHLLRESRALPLSYFRGLNFLLNEQPDKAIESFIEVVKVDPQTIDLHFALGSLFRRQGEIDRAIRMHQNLLDRPDLPADKRADGDVRARAGLPPRGPARPRRGALHQARRHAVRAPVARVPALDLRAGEGLAEGDRRRRAGWRRSPSSRTSRRSRTTTASSRRRRCSSPTSPTRATDLDEALAEYRACARATMLARRPRSAAGRRRARRSPRGRRSSRRTRRSCRSSPSASPTPTARPGDAAQGAARAARLPAAVSVARPAQRACSR